MQKRLILLLTCFIGLAACQNAKFDSEIHTYSMNSESYAEKYSFEGSGYSQVHSSYLDSEFSNIKASYEYKFEYQYGHSFFIYLQSKKEAGKQLGEKGKWYMMTNYGEIVDYKNPKQPWRKGGFPGSYQGPNIPVKKQILKGKIKINVVTGEVSTSFNDAEYEILWQSDDFKNQLYLPVLHSGPSFYYFFIYKNIEIIQKAEKKEKIAAQPIKKEEIAVQLKIEKEIAAELKKSDEWKCSPQSNYYFSTASDCDRILEQSTGVPSQSLGPTCCYEWRGTVDATRIDDPEVRKVYQLFYKAGYPFKPQSESAYRCYTSKVLQKLPGFQAAEDSLNGTYTPVKGLTLTATCQGVFSGARTLYAGVVSVALGIWTSSF